MPKSTLRKISQCKNCSLCDKVAEIHKKNEISELLDEVTQWDIKNLNQYKSINTYNCLVCFFKTSKFNDWKCHLMSISHMTNSHRIEDLYSYVCSSKGCKVLLYGPKKSLCKHRTDKHLEAGSITGIPVLMAEVMKRFITKLKPLYFCSHCKIFAETPIHTDNQITSQKSLKCPVKYYCKYCRVEFFSSPEMIDYHSLSVEHLTLKCFDKLCSKAKNNSKNLKQKEQSNENKENLCLPDIQDGSIPISLQLPKIVLNRFQQMSYLSCYCKFCNVIVNWKTKDIYSHLKNCILGFDLSGQNRTTVESFKCCVCNIGTNDIDGYKHHVTSKLHFTNCPDTYDYYSYFCDLCNIYMYSDKIIFENHWKTYHKGTIITEFSTLSKLMSNVFKDFNDNPDRVEIIHYYGNTNPNEYTKLVSLPCHSCKIEFHTSIDDFHKHEITTEHIILKFFTPKIKTKNENNITVTSKMLTTMPIISNKKVPFFQKCDDIKMFDNENIQNVQVNKNVLAQEKVWLDNAKCSVEECMFHENSAMESLKSNVCLKEFNVDLHNDSAKFKENELMQSQSKQQYIKYFKNKINLLNLLLRYKDRIIKTKSYYCDVCDFVTEEKCVWDNHNQTEHPEDSNRPTFYCYSCSMLIVGVNEKEHCCTSEHTILLEFIQSLQPTEEVLMEKTVLVKSVENCSLNNTLPTDLERNEQIDKVYNTKETLSDQYSDKSCENSSYLTKKKHIENEEDPLMSDTYFSLDNNVDKNKHISDDTTISNLVELNLNEFASTPNFAHNKKLIMIDQPNVNTKIQENFDCVDVSTSSNDLNNLVVLNETELEESIDEVSSKVMSDLSNKTTTLSLPLSSIRKLLENEKAGDLEEDKAYGDYVTQRLKMIENSKVKQDIKLEIDNIFYTKIKELKQNKN